MEMSTAEVVASYRQAAKPKDQIEILAQLNAVDRTVIESILRGAGIDIDDRPKKSAGQRQKWTAQEIDRLRELQAEGMTMLQAAEALGREKTAVATIASRNGISFGRKKQGKNAESSKPDPRAEKKVNVASDLADMVEVAERLSEKIAEIAKHWDDGRMFAAGLAVGEAEREILVLRHRLQELKARENAK